MTRIRSMIGSDYPCFARLFRELEADDPIPTPARFESEIVPSSLLAERDGHAVGYAYSNCFGRTGYVRHLVTTQASRRTGVGRTLIEELARRFRAAGATTWRLNVKPDNLPARSLYEKLGMRFAYRSVALRFDRSLLERLPVRETVVQPVAPALDEAFEARLGLPAGQIAFARRMPGRVLVGAFDAGAPRGLACFDPACSLAFPFRIAHPGLVRPLLTGCLAHASPGESSLEVVLDGEEALAAQLLSLGAVEKRRVLHYEGSL